MTTFFGKNKSIDNVMVEIERYFPPNDFLYKKSFISGNLEIQRKSIEGLLAVPYLNILQFLDAFFEGFFISKSSMFLEEFEREYGIPDEVFNDLTTIEKRKSNIKLKILKRKVFGWESSANDATIGIYNYMQLIGIELERVQPLIPGSGGWDKFANGQDFIFGVPYSNGRFVLTVRVLSNTNNFSIDFIQRILDSLTINIESVRIVL